MSDPIREEFEAWHKTRAYPYDHSAQWAAWEAGYRAAIEAITKYGDEIDHYRPTDSQFAQGFEHAVAMIRALLPKDKT